MKTSKVKEVNGVNEWTGGNGTVYYCKCVMDNGDKIEIGKKKPVEAGWELTYELTGDPNQQEYTKAKSVQPQQSSYSGNSDDRQKNIEFQTCLKVAGGIAVNWSSHESSPENVAAYAFELYKEFQKLKGEL